MLLDSDFEIIRKGTDLALFGGDLRRRFEEEYRICSTFLFYYVRSNLDGTKPTVCSMIVDTRIENKESEYKRLRSALIQQSKQYKIDIDPIIKMKV